LNQYIKLRGDVVHLSRPIASLGRREPIR